jgi:hypothetical protein
LGFVLNFCTNRFSGLAAMLPMQGAENNHPARTQRFLGGGDFGTNPCR